MPQRETHNTINPDFDKSLNTKTENVIEQLEMERGHSISALSVCILGWSQRNNTNFEPDLMRNNNLNMKVTLK